MGVENAAKAFVEESGADAIAVSTGNIHPDAFNRLFLMESVMPAVETAAMDQLCLFYGITRK